MVALRSRLEILTRTTYDALGRDCQSYPFTLGVGQNNIGTTISYDPLNRVTRETHPDDTFVEYVYAGTSVTVRDELHPVAGPRQTTYIFRAFGHPADARLMQVSTRRTRRGSTTTPSRARSRCSTAPVGSCAP